MEGITNNPALYKAMNKPFKNAEEHGESVRSFFRSVEDLRRLMKLPDVVILIRSSHKEGKAEKHALSTLFLGDSAMVVWILAETLNRVTHSVKDKVEITPNLIAAAPDLFAMLELIAAKIELSNPNSGLEAKFSDEEVKNIKQILAKAEGGEQV